MSTFDRKYEYVLQAIEHLRHRKARPDLEGIKNYAFRRYGIDPVTCSTDIEELILTEHIVKVEFKGRTSYRNAAKYFNQETPVVSEMSPLPSRDPSPEPNYTVCQSAIAAILCDQPNPPSQTGAVGLQKIASYLQSRHHGRYSRKYIDSLIEREISSSNIITSSKDSFTLPSSVLKHLDRRWSQEQMKNKSGGTSSGENNKLKLPKKKEKSPPPTPPRPERVGQRMKRAKKVFDPSDIVEVPRKRGRPVGTTKKNRDQRLSNSFATTPERSKSPFLMANTPPTNYSQSEFKFKPCLICKYFTVIVCGVTSKMLVCSECNRNVHAKCLGFDQDVLPRTAESDWKCPDCRPCSICKLIQEEDTILLCCECDTTFHRTCLNPIPEAVTEGDHRWVCDGCRSNDTAETLTKSPVKECTPTPEENKKQVPITLPFPTFSNLGPWVYGTRQLELKGPPFDLDFGPPIPDPTIPDAAVWTPEDVQNYFSRIGFEEQAALLRQHEIDGASLLLMKRNDVVRNMGLKLGPAVKIYNHIRRLQTRRDDLIYA